MHSKLRKPCASVEASQSPSDLLSEIERLGAGTAYVLGSPTAVSTAVENALKAAFDWKIRKNFERGYREERGTKVRRAS